MNIETILKRLENLKKDRYNWDSYFESLSFYYLPRKKLFTTERQSGTELDQELYDSTGRDSVLVLTAGLHGYMTNPSQKWFALRLNDERLQESQPVSEWLDLCENQIFDTLNSSNFNSQIHECYIDLAVYGTACLYEEEDPQDSVRFYARPLYEIYIAEDAKGRVNTVYRVFKLTARQAYDEWGDEAGELVRMSLEKEPDKKIEFVHAVMPREHYNPSKADAKNKPYISLYIEPTKKHVIKEGGYDEFPFFVPRFTKLSGEQYGYSPAMNCLPDMRTLNKAQEDLIIATEKEVSPPLDVPEEGYHLPLDQSANAVNYRRVGLAGEQLIRPLLPKRNIPIGMDFIQRLEDKVKRAFFVDLFLLLAERPKMTATEVMQRVNEKMLILGPTLGRLMNELLDPVITRTFNILMRQGKLPPPPPELQGVDYTIEYVSPLARAQKLTEAQAINNFVTFVGSISEITPSAFDNIDVDELVREYADIENIPVKILRDKAEVDRIRKERAEQERIAQEIALAQQGSQAIKNAAQAGKEMG